MSPTKTRTVTVRRDSGNGQFISKDKAEKKPANTWEKEKVKIPVPPKHKKP